MEIPEVALRSQVLSEVSRNTWSSQSKTTSKEEVAAAAHACMHMHMHNGAGLSAGALEWAEEKKREEVKMRAESQLRRPSGAPGGATVPRGPSPACEAATVQAGSCSR
ncbi:hypothetical protein SKAU_G00153390 [Synaphobranchus kaupii]|uniref:Uncharacterized protein n=1 Tax=Synaphobranchus kaupii TaxID=118154 RepID=A0A9Q1IWW9_SYNKA|nr:hypothetical protein SKAU_G00153390 [Synaphobranchus kaupii]